MTVTITSNILHPITVDKVLYSLSTDKCAIKAFLVKDGVAFVRLFWGYGAKTNKTKATCRYSFKQKIACGGNNGVAVYLVFVNALQGFFAVGKTMTI